LQNSGLGRRQYRAHQFRVARLRIKLAKRAGSISVPQLLCCGKSERRACDRFLNATRAPSLRREMRPQYAVFMLEKLFKLQEHGTTAQAELRARIVTFLALAYIVFVQPAVLAGAGMDFGAVIVATCISAGGCDGGDGAARQLHATRF